MSSQPICFETAVWGSLSSSKRLTRIQAAIDEPRINLLTVNVAEFIDPAG